MILSTIFLLCLFGEGIAQAGTNFNRTGDEKYDPRTDHQPAPPKLMWRIFGDSRSNEDEIVHQEEDEEGRRYYTFNKDIVKTFRQKIIPELCYLTPDNITIYNSFLLDRQFLEAMESVSPKCRAFRCDLAHYFLEHGAQVIADLFKTSTYREGVEVVHKEFSAAFEKLNMCTCGREFFKAVLKAAPYYHANVFIGLADEYTVVAYGRLMRNLDLKSLSKFFDRLMGGLCAESSKGLCLDSIFNGFEELADMLMTTVEDHEAYEDGDLKYRKSQEKRCDALFGPIRTWINDDRVLEWEDDELGVWEVILNKTAAVTNTFYCQKRCRKTRGSMYPCCLRKMMDDKKMFDNVARVVESWYKIVPSLDWDFRWDGFYEIDDYFLKDFPEEKTTEMMNWTVPDKIREALMRTVHGAKYCEGKTVKCTK